jgi:predicted nuclease of restriction endonuclease-like (RecB) superfamily
MTGIETDVREIKESIRVLTEKIDTLLHERETLAMMKLSEESLSAFLSEEPDLYTVRDARAVYR